MNVKIRGAVLAFVAMAVIAPNAPAQGTAGKGAIGGIVGIPFFLGDADTKNGQSPRILAQGQFQYAFTHQTRVALSAGYGWIGYKAGTPAPYKMFHPGLNDSVQVMDDVLTKFQPISASLLRSFRPQGKGFVPYVGAGVNLTRIEIVNDRRKIKDPETFDSYVNWSPGVQAQGGFEYFVGSGNVSFDGHGRFAKQFSKDADSFPSGFTGPHTYVTVNFGVNVYFWPIGHRPLETVPQPAAETDGAPLAPAPAVIDTLTPPTPSPTPPDTLTPPPSPAPPDTTVTPDSTVTPDTTRAPGSQSSILHRGTAAKTSVSAAAAKACAANDPAKSGSAIVIPRDEDGAICPVSSGGQTSGMFGVPGVPVVPPKAEESPPAPSPERPAPDDRSPEGSPTP